MPLGGIRAFLLVVFVVGSGASLRAACPGCAEFAPGILSGTVSFSTLTEASGIAASARNPGVLWTHNDGSAGRIWALSTNGARLATYDVNTVEDLEDVAVGPGPATGVSYLYVGDIGGNVGTNTIRSEVTVIRVPEPFVDLAWESDPRSPGFSGRDTFTLAYPDGSHDAETLLVDPLTSEVWVVTKEIGLAGFYRANLNQLPDGATVTMEFVRSVAFDQASAGDISADGTRLILRREDAAELWLRCDGESMAAALARASQTVPVIGPPTEPNGEGLGFLRDGTGYVTISEGVDPAIYFFRSICPAAPQFTLSLSNQTIFAGGSVQFQARAVGYPDPTYRWWHNGQLISGQTGSSLLLSNVALDAAGPYEVVVSNASGSATNGGLLTVRAKPELRITEVMSSAAASPGVPTADWWELTSFESQPVNLGGWRFNDNNGGLSDPFLIPGPLTIAPGESIVFAEALSAGQFANWWGTNQLPAGLQVVTYGGNGLSVGASGDGLRLWDSVTADVNDLVASVDFGSATAGVTFNYDPATQQFGMLSEIGVNGVFQAAAAPDIGSPGRITAPASLPRLQVTRLGGQLRIEFDAEAGHRYTLEVRDDFTTSAWTPSGDSFQPSTNDRVFFERDVAEDAQFFRVAAE